MRDDIDDIRRIVADSRRTMADAIAAIVLADKVLARQISDAHDRHVYSANPAIMA